MQQTHGGDILGSYLRTGHTPIDFSANINPCGMPEGVRDAALRAVAGGIHYPDPRCRELVAALAVHEGIPSSGILCGNGAADLIYRFAYALRPQKALLCAPTFSEYEAAISAAGGQTVLHMLSPDNGFMLTEDILPKIDDAQALFLCNPNNPTGQPVPPALLRAILDACAARQTYLLLDECFIDFLDDPAAHSCVPLLGRYPNLVILKAFTKLYAMPGLRLGYALCADGSFLEKMSLAGPPWSVSTVAQAAGIAALAEHTYVSTARALVSEERMFMKQMLAQLGLHAIGEANFLLFQAKPGLSAWLEGEGILVRNCASFQGLDDNWIRIAIRTRKENMALLSRLGRYLHG